MSMDKDAISALLARGGMTVQPIALPNGETGILVPDGYELERVAPRDVLPAFIGARPDFDDISSFIFYVNEYRTEASKLFASQDGGHIKAILDYHTPKATAHLGHQPLYSAKLSDEWKVWSDVNGRLQGQAHFAEFIEENARSIFSPDSATLMEMVTTLEAKTEIIFQSKVKLASGTQNLQYEETQTGKGGGALNIPTELTVQMPVYRGGAVYDIKVYLRCKIDGGKAMFMTKIHEIERTKRFAFTALCLRVAAETETLVLHGTAR